MRAAVELAVQDINAAGGVNDADVVLESNQDDGTDPDKAS
ncbi:MAG: branched-chain amino acid ABC transporter substrate-binding protein, partial [Dokdonella sp.]